MAKEGENSLIPRAVLMTCQFTGWDYVAFVNLHLMVVVSSNTSNFKLPR